jgi:hypothetical protein
MVNSQGWVREEPRFLSSNLMIRGVQTSRRLLSKCLIKDDNG